VASLNSNGPTRLLHSPYSNAAKPVISSPWIRHLHCFSSSSRPCTLLQFFLSAVYLRRELDRVLCASGLEKSAFHCGFHHSKPLSLSLSDTQIHKRSGSIWWAFDCLSNCLQYSEFDSILLVGKAEIGIWEFPLWFFCYPARWDWHMRIPIMIFCYPAR